MGSDESGKLMKLYLRGTISNGLGLGLLFGLGKGLDVASYAAVALGMQWTTFLLHGLPFRSEKFYDLSGSFTHFAVVAASLTREERVRSCRQIFTSLASTLWMSRLGTFLYSRILKDGKDGRFDHLKKTWLSFLGAWTLQALWVSLTQLPVLLSNKQEDKGGPLTAMDYLCMTTWAAGFLMEAAADTQKMAFREDPSNRHRYITSGLWRYSRHPNYFGEILMWTSQALLVSLNGLRQGRTSDFWSFLSPAFSASLLLFLSGVPMVEQAGLKKWGQDPEYLRYMAKTSCIIPWFPAGPFPEKRA